VFATDRSADAVDLARVNAKRLELDVEVLEGDLFSLLPVELRGRVDLVVSNPPYVAAEEHERLSLEVRADPPSALVGDVDVYERLAAEASDWLGAGGVFVVEVDSRRAREVVDVIERLGFFDVLKVKDLNGRDRVVWGRRP